MSFYYTGPTPMPLQRKTRYILHSRKQNPHDLLSHDIHVRLPFNAVTTQSAHPASVVPTGPSRVHFLTLRLRAPAWTNVSCEMSKGAWRLQLSVCAWHCPYPLYQSMQMGSPRHPEANHSRHRYRSCACWPTACVTAPGRVLLPSASSAPDDVPSQHQEKSSVLRNRAFHQSSISLPFAALPCPRDPAPPR